MSYQFLTTVSLTQLARTIIAACVISAFFLTAPAGATDPTNSAGRAEATLLASTVQAEAAKEAVPAQPETPQPAVDQDYLAKGLALAAAKNCMACHQVDSRRVGPPFASVASRYGPGSGLTDYLAKTIREGGRGRWGAVPMPAQPRVSEAEAVELAKWILSLPVPPKP